jgi:dynein heavy chain
MLSRDLLSKQRHYDWGLRAVKSVLRQAGKLKRGDPNLSEDELLMKGLRDFNMPKIVTDDKNIFIKLIEDLFPSIKYVMKVDLDLKKIVMQTTKKDMGLIAEEIFTLKVIQMAEILEVRHPVILIPGITGTYLYKNYDDKGEIWPNLLKILFLKIKL